MGDNVWFLGMTTHAEQAYFEEYARTKYSGVGAIVDLGCWLGSTTIQLARGLSNNPNPKAASSTIHAYDLFEWNEWMSGVYGGAEIEGKYKPGECFLDEFERRIAPWKDRIVAHPGDLIRANWEGQPIEFLLIDAMKSWELANDIVHKFFPFLIPGKSYVVHQDFAHYYTSWIHFINYRLRDYFRLVHIEPPSFVFECIQQIPEEFLAISYQPSRFSHEEVESAFAYSMNLTSDKNTQAFIAASKVMHFVHAGDTTTARITLQKVLSEGFPLVSELQLLQKQLNVSP